jgi:hypothetical protein
VNGEREERRKDEGHLLPKVVRNLLGLDPSLCLR